MSPGPTSWVGGEAARHGWGRTQGIHSPDDRRFVGLAAAALDDYFARNPIDASAVGDRRFDDRLPDYTTDGVAEQVRVLNRHLLALDTIDPLGLSRANAIDLGMLQQRLTAQVFQLRTLGEPTWNPQWWSPGRALEPLLARRQPDLPPLVARVLGLGEHLEAARQTLEAMPRVHVQQALVELDCTGPWLTAELGRLAADNDRAAADLADARAAALAALAEHRAWLAGRLATSTRDPRLGPRNYADTLRLLVGTDAGVDELRRWAEEDLAQLSEQLRSLASQVMGRSMATRRLVPSALSAIADAYELSPSDLIPAAARSVAAARAFTVEQELVTVPDLELDVVPMPPLRSRSVARYSDSWGASATGEPARVMVAGPAADWSEGRRTSFLRENNAVMLDVVMAHHAIPGHALLAAHARRAAAPTAIRSVFPAMIFVEGWAGYAQQQLTKHDYRGSLEQARPAEFALQELKLRLRGVVNALLDIGYHTGTLDEPSARRLLATGALAEEGEFVVKWARVQTSAGSLTRAMVGRHLMDDLVDSVRAHHPSWSTRQTHDRILGNGAIPPAMAKELIAAQ